MNNKHVVVIGGGIAGASAAHFLAETKTFDRVTLLEAESQLAHHTTGRSAALLTENYGEGPVRPLTTASLDFLHNPPSALVDGPLLEPRGIMNVASDEAGNAHIDRFLDEGKTASHPIVEITVDEAKQRAPHIRFISDSRVMWEEYSFRAAPSVRSWASGERRGDRNVASC